MDGSCGLQVLEEADDDIEEDDGCEGAAFDPGFDTKTGSESED